MVCVTHNKKNEGVSPCEPADSVRKVTDEKKPAEAGLWSEAHHRNQQEVDDGGSDDRAKNHFGIVRHMFSKKDPAFAGSGV